MTIIGVLLQRLFLKVVDIEGLYDSVLFSEVSRMPLFYRQVLKYYNKALFSDRDFLKKL